MWFWCFLGCFWGIFGDFGLYVALLRFLGCFWRSFGFCVTVLVGFLGDFGFRCSDLRFWVGLNCLLCGFVCMRLLVGFLWVWLIVYGVIGILALVVVSL